MEEGKAILQKQKNLILYQGTLYHCHTPAGELEEVLWLIVPMAHSVAAMNGCHQDVGHEGQQWTLYLLQDSGGSAWPHRCRKWLATVSNASNMKVLVQNANAAHHCHCFFGVATCEFHKHWDGYRVRPNTKHGECFGLLQSLYKTCHGLCDPNQTAKTVATFLWQGYI